MQGADRRHVRLAPRLGIIPAHAGSRWSLARHEGEDRDHPRACREQRVQSGPVRSERGSSPRMQGAGRRRVGALPRGRIIPAHAGSRPWSGRSSRLGQDHPRACREQSSIGLPPHRSRGSSPRMQGAGDAGDRTHRPPRIIPAHAGSRSRPGLPARSRPDHPRACREQARGIRDRGL